MARRILGRGLNGNVDAEIEWFEKTAASPRPSVRKEFRQADRAYRFLSDIAAFSICRWLKTSDSNRRCVA
ncbi:hypothetical protein [Rhizobium herbae]